MKLSREQLKRLVKEELKSVLGEKLTDDEKEEKKDLEGKLKKLDHKWMDEGKLSSALMKRYGISKENAKGVVLWHSLNENGNIGAYDMKFGNTIVRNLLAEDIEPVVVKEHKHTKRDDDDPKRDKKK